MRNLNDIINEQEEIELRKLANNDIALNALKKVLMIDIYSSGTLEPGKDPDFTRNFCLSFLYDPATGAEYSIDNQKMGEKLRSALEGIRMVQSAFNTLSKLRDKEEDTPEEDNPAR